MKKMLLILGMVVVLLCGCGNTEVKSESTSYVDKTIERCSELAEDTKNDMIDLYTRALEDIYGEDLEVKEYKMDDNGITINGRFVSWEYVEEVAYNLMTNE